MKLPSNRYYKTFSTSTVGIFELIMESFALMFDSAIMDEKNPHIPATELNEASHFTVEHLDDPNRLVFKWDVSFNPATIHVARFKFFHNKP